MSELELTSSIYSFEKLRTGSFLYIDKTEYLWNLLRPSCGMYFLSRPRRFGKSLTLSTLKAVFEGKKELFKGLALYDKPYSWEKHPVIHLDMNGRRFDTLENLERSLREILKEQALVHKVELEYEASETMFQKLILRLSEQGGVVVLLDEYDKPILENILSPDAQKFMDALKSFYSVIKGKAELFRFVFVTGVTKFCHVSIFSDLNNLFDITMDERYACMLGYTQEEFERYFASRIAETEKLLAISHESFLAKIKAWYDGYRFAAKAESVYNPVSLAAFFMKGGEFSNFWFSTGTPSFLMQLVRKTNFDFEAVLNKPISALAFSAYEVNSLDPLPLLLQTGYLTIRDSFEDFGMTFYNLAFPNIEVRSAFDSYLLNAYTDINREALSGYAMELATSVREGKIEKFMETLKMFFSAIPYDIQLADEKYYQTVFYILFLLLGVYIEAEARTNRGRIDAVAACGDWVYIFEFKLNQNAPMALSQIRDREYYQKYHRAEKRIVLVGANFDSGKRQISDWLSEEL